MDRTDIDAALGEHNRAVDVRNAVRNAVREIERIGRAETSNGLAQQGAGQQPTRPGIQGNRIEPRNTAANAAKTVASGTNRAGSQLQHIANGAIAHNSAVEHSALLHRQAPSGRSKLHRLRAGNRAGSDQHTAIDIDASTAGPDGTIRAQ